MDNFESNRQIVRKSYELITSRNSWTEIEGKLLATFIKELNPKSEDDFKEMNVSINSIQELWGVKVDVSHIRRLCLELKKKTYEIPEYDINKDGTINYSKVKAYDYVSLFANIKYHLNDRYISFRFDESMKPHLLNFTRFVKYKINNILKFKSSYSISFYEYFKAEMFKQESIKETIMGIDQMSLWLQLPKSYSIYNNLKRKVLLPVISDLQKHSDIYVTFNEIKEGKKVSFIKFNITKNIEGNKNTKPKLIKDDKLIGKNCYYGGKKFYHIINIIKEDDLNVVIFNNGDKIKFKNLEDIYTIIVD